MSDIRRQYEPPKIEREGVHEADFEVYQYGDWHLAQIIAQGGRALQQDRDVIIPFGEDGFVSIICDGHGRRGEDAAEDLTAGILDYVEALPLGESIDPAQFEARVAMLDAAVKRVYPEGGSTLLCTYVGRDSNVLHIGSIGDTEARVIRPNGKLERITWPHNFSHTIEKRRLGYEETEEIPRSQQVLYAADSRARLAVTRAVGDDEFPEAIAKVEWKQHTFADGEVLILASDGLWDRIDSSTKRRRRLRDIAMEHTDANDIMNIFLKECVTDGWTFHDNMSMHIVTK